MFNKNRKINRKGSALAYALVIIAVVSIILVSLLQYITSQLRFSFYRGDSEQAFQISESGVYFYRWYLAHQVSGKTTQQIETFWQSGHPYGVGTAYESEFFDPEGGAIGKYKIEVQPPSPGSTIVIVKSTGWTYREPTVKRIVQVRFRRSSWSEFAVVANDVMRFGPDTEVFGRIHSNNGIRFDGTAHNVVSSAMDKYDDPDHNGAEEFGVHTHVDPVNNKNVGNSFVAAEAPPATVQTRSDVFLAGRQFPVPAVDFNGMISDLNSMKIEAQTPGHGIYYNNSNCGNKANLGRHIIINGDKMTVSTVTGISNGDYSITKESCVLSNVAIPANGIVFVENSLWLEGTINNRRVTFVAANLTGGAKSTIFLGMNNLLYTNFDGRDIIGLIAQQDIEVVKNSLDNLTIDAALLAQSGRIGRNNYTPLGCNSQSCQDHKGTITINGAMATDLRYGFAYTNGTGYSNRVLNFDNNLLYFPPPYFPTGTEYSIDLWDEL